MTLNKEDKIKGKRKKSRQRLGIELVNIESLI